MIETITHLKNAGMKLFTLAYMQFTKNAYQEIKNSGAEIITCNTIPHETIE
jgi:phosphoribosylpyrophosphate synthetase